MTEATYQANLKKKITRLLPGCMILKNDARLRPGIPDLLILYRRRWAMLEVKVDADSKKQPNQDWYVDHLDGMSFAAFIHPAIERDVLRALQQALQS